MKVSQIMTKDVIAIRGSARVTEAVKLMKEKGIHTLIVDRQHTEDAYGIVTDTDIMEKVVAFGKDAQKIRVYEIMTKPCIVVNPDLSVEYAARLFTNTNIRSAPVIKDELLGIVTATDIINKGDFIEQPKEVEFENKIKTAVEEARRVCSEKGHSSPECATAWDIVEELQAEAAHQRARKPKKTALEEYLEEFPQAVENLMMENWCSG
jgi:CBS domain-containing protein